VLFLQLRIFKKTCILHSWGNTIVGSWIGGIGLSLYTIIANVIREYGELVSPNYVINSPISDEALAKIMGNMKAGVNFRRRFTRGGREF